MMVTDMSFLVKELIQEESMQGVKLLAGNEGLENQIKGVTIIEAPDIVKFINGGEVLLTGLYAFRSCSLQEFEQYMQALSKKSVSAIILKRGRYVEEADSKIESLLKYAKLYKIPVLETPFEVSFRDIMSLIMERLFNEEVTKLKYFKTTHDNFTALVFSLNPEESAVDRILDVLAKLIGNPVAVFNQNQVCIATTSEELSTLEIQPDKKVYEPNFYSNYSYHKQKLPLEEGEEEKHRQHLIGMQIPFGVRLYLVITEQNRRLVEMDYIAIENAITVLQNEFLRQYAVSELETKFQNDIMHNILNGKVYSQEELKKSTKLLGVNLEGDYRVVVFGLEEEEDSFDGKMKQVKTLQDIVAEVFPKETVLGDFDKVIMVQSVGTEERQEVYRTRMQEQVDKMQSKMKKQNCHLAVKAGIGKVVSGLMNLTESFKEAGDALMFADVAGDVYGQETSQVMMFSDLGIFKLLCQIKDPEELLEYVPESLQKLYNSKKSQKNDLLITLKTYLDRSQNLTKTAQDLFMHYKTAAYRIGRIEEITGIDFDNANEVLAVRIGLIVYKMIEKLEK